MSFDEHRYHFRLQQYWDSLRGSHPFPREEEVDPDELSDIWTSCFLISIDDVTRRAGYRYSYLGAELADAYGDDVSNPDISDTLLATAGAPMVQKFDEAMRKKAPVTDESEFINCKKLNIKYRTCILPLGTPGGDVTHLLGCMRWKIY